MDSPETQRLIAMGKVNKKFYEYVTLELAEIKGRLMALTSLVQANAISESGGEAEKLHAFFEAQVEEHRKACLARAHEFLAQPDLEDVESESDNN
jgi:hypothetical protein